VDSTPTHTDGLTTGHNVTLTFDFEFGLDHLVPGGYKYEDLALQAGGASDVTVIYDYGSCATLSSKWLHCKLQTHHFVREGALHEKERKKLSFKEIKIWSSVPQGAQH
jgi:hypothetical protein